MSLAAMSLADLVGTFIGLIFTLLVFSYIIGDNALFRVVIHIFIGVAAGYATVVVCYNVIWPQLLFPVLKGTSSEKIFAMVPLLLSGLLMFKISPTFSRFGNVPMAFLVGVGAATAIGGAVLGTIFPQVGTTINLFDLETGGTSVDNTWVYIAKASIVLIGTLSTFIYFHFGARRSTSQSPERANWIERLAWMGQIFIAITFGVLFAGVFSAALTAFIERILFIADILLPLLSFS